MLTTVDELIEQLQEAKVRYGGDTPVVTGLNGKLAPVSLVRVNEFKPDEKGDTNPSAWYDGIWLTKRRDA